MMTQEMKYRLYRNIALLIFLLLTSIAVSFASETAVELHNEKVENTESSVK